MPSRDPARNAVIITSRHTEIQRLDVLFEIDAITDEKDVQLLLREINDDSGSDEQMKHAKSVVAKLENLALAIDQASSYLSANQMSMQAYEKILEEYGKEVALSYTPAMREYQTRMDDDKALSIFTTWELSFSQIAFENHQKDLIDDFLTLVAFLNASKIEKALFKTYVEQRPDLSQNLFLKIFLCESGWDSFKFQDVIIALANLSLVQ